MAFNTLVDDDGNNIGASIDRSLERIADALEKLVEEPEPEPVKPLEVDPPQYDIIK